MSFLVPDRTDTQRLRLRMLRAGDYPVVREYFADEETTRYTTGRALSDAESWRVLCTAIGHWHVRGYGPYAVVNRDSDRMLGTVGFWFPIDWPGPEIKWTLLDEHRGQGFASEAARAVQALAREHLPDIAFISLVHPDNAASIRVAEAVGATLKERGRLHGIDHLVFEHPR